MESLYKAIGMDLLPDEYLPDDYTGPSAGPIQQIVGTWISYCNDWIFVYTTIVVYVNEAREDWGRG